MKFPNFVHHQLQTNASPPIEITHPNRNPCSTPPPPQTLAGTDGPLHCRDPPPPTAGRARVPRPRLPRLRALVPPLRRPRLPPPLPRIPSNSSVAGLPPKLLRRRPSPPLRPHHRYRRRRSIAAPERPSAPRATTATTSTATATPSSSRVRVLVGDRGVGRGRHQLSMMDPPAGHEGGVLTTAEDGVLGFVSRDDRDIGLWSWQAGPDGAAGRWAQRGVIDGSTSTRCTHALAAASGTTGLM